MHCLWWLVLKVILVWYLLFFNTLSMLNATGHPKPSVIWFRQRGFYEEIVDDSYEFVPLNSPINGTLSTVSNVLHFSRLDRNDYLARYLCRASTRFYHPPLVQTITIDMNCNINSILISVLNSLFLFVCYIMPICFSISSQCANLL